MIVVIVTEEGSHHPLEVGLMETVLEVKQKIELLLGAPVACQTLSIYDIELVDGFEMEFYGINERTQINLIVSSNNRYQIVVKILRKSIWLEVEETDTVHSLKEKIHEKNGADIEKLVLFNSGTEMEDHCSLRDYGISMHSEVIAITKPMSRPRNEPQAKVLNFIVQTSSLLNSMRIPLEMNKYYTTGDVRRRLLDGNYLPQDDYLFIHKQRIMKENQTLNWHGVRSGDIIHVFKGTVSSEY